MRFGKKDVMDLLKDADIYGQEIRDRVAKILFEQMRRYPYLWENKVLQGERV